MAKLRLCSTYSTCITLDGITCNVHINNVYSKSAIGMSIFRLAKIFTCKHTMRFIYFFDVIFLNCIHRFESTKHLLITQAFSEALCEQQRTGGSQPPATNSSHSALVFDQPNLIRLHQDTWLFLELTSTRALNCAETWTWCRLLTDTLACAQIAHSVLNAWLCKYLQLKYSKVVLNVFFFHLLAVHWCVSLCV